MLDELTREELYTRIHNHEELLRTLSIIYRSSLLRELVGYALEGDWKKALIDVKEAQEWVQIQTEKELGLRGERQ